MLRLYDGYDDYSSSQFSDKGFYVTTGALMAGNARYGSQCLQANASDNRSLRAIGASASTWYMGCGFKTLGTTPGDIFSLWDRSTGTMQVRLNVEPSTMRLRVFNGSGSQIGSTSTESIVINGWNWVEFGVFIHDTLGNFEVRLQQSTVISASNVDTRNGTPTTADAIGFAGNGSSGIVTYQDDLYVCDDTGTTNNNFLGDCRVEVIYPTGAGNYTQFTPSTGSNWQNVDDAQPNSDTDYNSSGTAGNKDTFVMGNLTSTGGTIYGVKYSIFAKKDNAGAKSLAPVQRQSSTDYIGTTRSLLDTYTYFEEIKETNPSTGVAWTIADVNTNAEFGYEVVA